MLDSSSSLLPLSIDFPWTGWVILIATRARKPKWRRSCLELTLVVYRPITSGTVSSQFLRNCEPFNSITEHLKLPFNKPPRTGSRGIERSRKQTVEKSRFRSFSFSLLSIAYRCLMESIIE